MGEPADERDDEHDLSPEDEEELMRRCDEAEEHPEKLIPHAEAMRRLRAKPAA
jgi:hypothetical protein